LLQRNEESSISNYQLGIPKFPALALLISGGHTEMVLMKDWLSYEMVGRTRDDAIGEAFDKVARILGLPYPGGPEISKLAEQSRKSKPESNEYSLPRPMIHSDNFDFSFSGLKTSILYLVKKLPTPLTEKTIETIAREFEDAATEVVIEKVKKAIEAFGIETLILGGGVVANKNIRSSFEKLAKELNLSLKLPAINHATDNALMIAIAGFLNQQKALTATTGLLDVKANGNLSFPTRAKAS
jgi:N6-L-threonylcarbamoyladenine synthase